MGKDHVLNIDFASSWW